MVKYRTEFGYIKSFTYSYSGTRHGTSAIMKLKIHSGCFEYYYQSGPEFDDKIKSILKDAGVKTVNELINRSVAVTLSIVDECIDSWKFQGFFVSSNSIYRTYDRKAYYEESS